MSPGSGGIAASAGAEALSAADADEDTDSVDVIAESMRKDGEGGREEEEEEEESLPAKRLEYSPAKVWTGMKFAGGIFCRVLVWSWLWLCRNY